MCGESMYLSNKINRKIKLKTNTNTKNVSNKQSPLAQVIPPSNNI